MRAVLESQHCEQRAEGRRRFEVGLRGVLDGHGVDGEQEPGQRADERQHGHLECAKEHGDTAADIQVPGRSLRLLACDRPRERGLASSLVR